MNKFLLRALTAFAGRVFFLAITITLITYWQEENFNFLHPFLFESARYTIAAVFYLSWSWAGYYLGSCEQGRFMLQAMAFGVLVEIPTILNYIFNPKALSVGFFPFVQILSETRADFTLIFFLFLMVFMGSYILAAFFWNKPNLFRSIILSLALVFTISFLGDLSPRVLTTINDQHLIQEEIHLFHQLLVEKKFKDAAVYTTQLQPDEIAEYWSTVTGPRQDYNIERILLSPARRYYMLPNGDKDKYARRYLLEVNYLTGGPINEKSEIYVEIFGEKPKIRLLKVL